jgi:Ferritin-like
MTERLFARNLTAKAAIKIVGNPVTTRLESGVGNCFPGLEFDHRNLDRRFFPGLVFNFGVMPPILADLDPSDPALAAVTPDDAAHLSKAVSDAMADLQIGSWTLTSIAQDGRTIDLTNAPNMQDPAQFWRLVRDLRPDKVTIALIKAADPPASGSPAAPPPVPLTKTLTHYRRRFVDADTGVISDVFRPGELTQSLCSPWMHDFRDCACDYWASNHPDIVLGEDNFPLTDDLAAADPQAATRPLDWLRADRKSRVAASASASVNEAFQLRHYQINKEWRSLAFVLEGHEISAVYAPGAEPMAEPFPTAEELADELTQLCGLEHVVMLEYLYAYYSLRQPTDVSADHADDLTFARHELLAVAVSEMRHLRWANQLLWTMAQKGMIERRPPMLTPGLTVPTVDGDRPRSLRPLQTNVLADFVAVERPSSTLDGEYARVVATLARGYPDTMLQLARQIVVEGTEHFARFSEIAKVLGSWSVASGAPTPWLRPIVKATEEQASAALDAYRSVLAHLGNAYQFGDMEDASQIVEGRLAMMRLDTEAEKLGKAGLGVPFF